MSTSSANRAHDCRACCPRLIRWMTSAASRVGREPASKAGGRPWAALAMHACCDVLRLVNQDVVARGILWPLVSSGARASHQASTGNCLCRFRKLQMNHNTWWTAVILAQESLAGCCRPGRSRSAPTQVCQTARIPLEDLLRLCRKPDCRRIDSSCSRPLS